MRGAGGVGSTPQGQAADAQFVMEHQREAEVFTTVSGQVEELSENPVARVMAQEIGERVMRAEQR